MRTASAADTSVIVVGGGPAGLASALALAAADVPVTLAAGPHRPGGFDRDRRTAALFAGSIELLRNLGVWDGLKDVCEPLKTIRLIDDTGRLFRAPEVKFNAHEAGLEAFGFNVPNDALVDALSARVAATAGITVVTTAGVRAVRIGQGRATVVLGEGSELSAPLAVAADGRKSPTRDAAGITVKTWSYPQTAVVTWFAHQRPHDGISTEFHRAVGPFTTVPMPGRCSSLVWVEEPAEAERLSSALGDGLPARNRGAARRSSGDSWRSRSAGKVSAERADAGRVRPQSGGTRRRVWARHSAHRCAGSEPRIARCCHTRRLRQGRCIWGPRSGRVGSDGPLQRVARA